MKKFVSLILAICLVVSLMGCSKKMTLKLSFGDRNGTYTGDLNKDGLPNGYGRFVSKNDEGEKWTYEGEFKNGHFDGKGKITWKNGLIEIGTYKDDIIVPMKGDEIKSLYTTPKKFKNHYVEITGVVFADPEYDDDGLCVQMMADIKNHSNNTIVYINDKDFKVNQNDYLHIVGLVGDEFKGENAFGGDVTAPVITAKEYKVLDYKDALAPTIKTININQSKTQLGYTVTVQKIEFAEDETRAYIRVDNQGTDKFSVYSFNSMITQNGKQYEEQDNWDAEYPEIQTELLVGNSSEGIIVFPAIPDGTFNLIIEGSSDNWEEDLEPYTFNIEG